MFEFALTHKYTVSVCINSMKCTKARAIDMQTRGSVCLVTKRDKQPQNLLQCYPTSALFALVFSRRVAKSPCASPDKLVWSDWPQPHIPTHNHRNHTLDWVWFWLSRRTTELLTSSLDWTCYFFLYYVKSEFRFISFYYRRKRVLKGWLLQKQIMPFAQ